MKQSRGRKIINVVLVFIITFLLNVVWSAVAGVIFGIVLMINGVNATDPKLIMEALSQNMYLLFFSSFYNLFAIGVIFLFWHYADKRSREELGFGLTVKTRTQVLLGITVGLGAVMLITVFGTVFGVISFQGFGTGMFKGVEIAISLALGIITFLMVGLGEETVYRAYIQKHIVEMAGNKLGLVISALIFMSAHLLTYGKLLDLIDVFLAGMVLGYAYLLTKSIYLSAAFHFMWDFLQVNVVRLQDYEYYKGPTLILFNNTGDLIINNFNLGNRLELVFILVEVIILILMFVSKGRIKNLSV